MTDLYTDLLVDHVIRPWFPASIDRYHGGFLCDFDRQWRNRGPNHKLLEFQARQTLTAAELLTMFPGNPDLREAASTGFAFLRDVLWDAEYGGWHALTDRSGTPLEVDIKHSHGMAYAAQACLAVHAVLEDPSALSLAKAALDWLDGSAWDTVHGGYFGPLSRDGGRLAEFPDGRPTDAIGTPPGLKDMNVNSDFYEMLTYASAGDEFIPSVAERLSDLREIILSHYAVPGSPPLHHYTPDWRSTGSMCNSGTALQTASRLLEDGAAIRPEHQRAARHLVQSTFGGAWDKKRKALHGSFHADGAVNQKSDFHWWVQLELLRAAAYLSKCDPQDEDVCYIRESAETVIRRLLDTRSSGTFTQVRPSPRFCERVLAFSRRFKGSSKGHAWKDASHDGRTFLKLSALQDGLPHSLPTPDSRPVSRQMALSDA